MKKRMIAGFLGLTLSAGWGMANDLVPVAVSPGLAGGAAVVRQDCPTFSWTSVSWALTYKVIVFEATGLDNPAYETMAAQASPVLSQDVPGKALSWTPSAADQLINGGSYIWYVGAMVGETGGRWSEGRRFMVAERPAWDYETQKRALKALRDSGVSEDVSKKVLREMNGGIAGSFIAGFALTGGPQSGVQGTEGTYNTFYGKYAGNTSMTGNYNSFFGRSAGYANAGGSKNTFIGFYAGRENTSASSNTFVGYEAGYHNANGSCNTFVGNEAGISNTSGQFNTFVGYAAGNKNTAANGNTFVGILAGSSTTSGIYNSFFGESAGSNNTTGKENSFVGGQAGFNNTGGNSNTCVGYRAGYSNSTGTGNVFLGNYAGFNEKSSNKLYIANSNTSLPLIYGEFYLGRLVFNGRVGIQNTAPTHKLDVGTNGAYCNGGAWVDGSSRTYKENIEELTSSEALLAFEGLQPVKFNYKMDKEEQYLGFIAEDVPGLVAMKDRKGLNPMDIVAMLTKVVQEQMKISREQTKALEDQKRTISSQQQALSAQGKELSELKEKIAKLEKASRS